MESSPGETAAIARLWETRSAAVSRLESTQLSSVGLFFVWGDPGFQSSPLWVLLVLVLYTGLLSLALQFTAGAQSSLGLNKRPHRHEAGEYSLTPVFCP